MNIWRYMRLRKHTKEMREKIVKPKQKIFEQMCLNEFCALCQTDNQEVLRFLQKEQLKGYTKWRKKHMDASPLEFFNK